MYVICEDRKSYQWDRQGQRILGIRAKISSSDLQEAKKEASKEATLTGCSFIVCKVICKLVPHQVTVEEAVE